MKQIGLFLAVAVSFGALAGWDDYSAGEAVVIEAGAKEVAVDADFEKINKLGSLTVNAGAELDLTISGDVTITCPVVNNGKITRRGEGTLRFTREMGVEGLRYGELVLDDGWTWCPQDYEGWQDFYLGTTTVGADATLVTAAQSADSVDALRRVNTICNGLMGYGVITNVTTSNDCQLRCDGTRAEPYVFYGSIRPKGLRYYSNGHQWLMNPVNTFEGEFAVRGNNGGYPQNTQGVVGLPVLGEYNKPAANGTGSFTSRDGGGAILYLGTGETTTKQYNFYGGSMHFFDAGAHGGIRFEGQWVNNGNSEIVVVTGSNAAPCVLANRFNGDNAEKVTYVVKRGTGTWRFAEHSQRDNRGVIAVEEGTLQFTSIAETNRQCSLGYANNLQSAYSSKTYDPTKNVDYAFLLGTGATRGVMEYVGAGDASCTTRVFAVKGEGEIRNGAAEGVMLQLSGAKNAPGESGTLVLGGTNSTKCYFSEICDADGGTIGVAKEGTGTWRLIGRQDFSGPLAVKQGTLEVQGAETNVCTWFRFVMRGTTASRSSGDSNIYVGGVELYDKDGASVTYGKMTFVPGYETPSTSGWAADETQLKEGEFCWARHDRTYTYYEKRDFGGIFDFADGSDATVTWNTLDPNDPAKWAPIQFRLPAGAKTPVRMDVLSKTAPSSSRALTDWSLFASPNGIDWTEVVRYDYDPKTIPATGGRWFSNPESSRTAGASRPGAGYEIAPVVVEDSHALRNVTSVSVAPGATLKACGHVVLPAVALDCSGVGTIDGFTLPAAGTLEVLNAAEGRVTLPNPFVNCAGRENLVGWTLKVDGGEPHGKKVYLRGDDLVLAPLGTAVIVR